MTATLSGRALFPFVEDRLQEAAAALIHIPPCDLKISGVPRIRHIAGAVGIIHQKVDFPLAVAATDAVHIAEIGAVHADQKIIGRVIVFKGLSLEEDF